MIVFVLHQILKITGIQGVNTTFMDFAVYVHYMPSRRLRQLQALDKTCVPRLYNLDFCDDAMNMNFELW